MSDLKKQREELVELFGVHFENLMHLSPLGARIFAVIIVDSCGGKVSFEDLVEGMGASKSSVSTNLNLLLKIGKISYYTMPGDRKKYYKPTPFSDRFDNYMNIINQEKKIIDKMVAYRQHTLDSPCEKRDLERLEVYKEHIGKMEEVIAGSIEKFRKLEINDPI